MWPQSIFNWNHNPLTKMITTPEMIKTASFFVIREILILWVAVSWWIESLCFKRARQVDGGVMMCELCWMCTDRLAG